MVFIFPKDKEWTYHDEDFRYLELKLDKTNAEYTCHDCLKTFYIISNKLWNYELRERDIPCKYCHGINTSMIKGESNGKYI